MQSEDLAGPRLHVQCWRRVGRVERVEQTKRLLSVQLHPSWREPEAGAQLVEHGRIGLDAHEGQGSGRVAVRQPLPGQTPRG